MAQADARRADRARGADPVDHDPALGPRACASSTRRSPASRSPRRSSSASRRAADQQAACFDLAARARRARAVAARRRGPAPHLVPQGRGHRPALHTARPRAAHRKGEVARACTRLCGRALAPSSSATTSRSASSASGSTRPGARLFAEELRGGDLSTVDRRRASPRCRRAPTCSTSTWASRSPTRPSCCKAMLRTVAEAPTCRSASTPRSSRRSRPGCGLRGQGAGQLGHRRGRAAGGDPPARHAPRRGGHRPAQRRERDPRDAAAAAGDHAQDRRRPPATTASRPRTSSSTRWRCRSAPTPTRSTITLETISLIRDELGVNMTLRRVERLVRHARPPRARRGVPADGDAGRADQRDHELRREIVAAVHAADLLLGHDEWGARWIAAHRAARGGRRRRPSMSPRPAARRARTEPLDELAASTAPSASGCASCPTAPRCGCPAARRLRRRELERHRHRLDLRRARHVQQVQGAGLRGRGAGARRRPARVQPRRAARRLAAGLPRARARGPRVEVPPLLTRPKAAPVGVGRQVILRPAVQKRYVELDEPTLADQRTDLERLLDAIDDLEPHVPPGRSCASSAACCAPRTSRSPR